MYRIRKVDCHDDEIAADLHRLTFLDGPSIPEFEQWLAFWRQTIR
jgi:hypothetical protein